MFSEPIDRRMPAQDASNPVCWYAGKVKATFDLDNELYRAIKVEAARHDRSVREIVEEALHAWLEATEEAEDIADSAAAIAEYERAGGAIEAHEFFGTLAAETKEAYGPDRR